MADAFLIFRTIPPETTWKFAYPIEKWPYPIANSNDALVQAIRSFDESDYKNKVAEHLRDAVAYDNGTASEQAVNLIAKYCFKKKK